MSGVDEKLARMEAYKHPAIKSAPKLPWVPNDTKYLPTCFTRRGHVRRLFACVSLNAMTANCNNVAWAEISQVNWLQVQAKEGLLCGGRLPQRHGGAGGQAAP